ncbi:zinc ribbon domain-containing protein [Metabacillus sp. KIGAM252]|uniref:Zinc ribbon domain-containing protein n=1 Tax=Metabacillus flavus TaxID=2823519 RepID=A0ABS5LDS4_9BACI|nr:zinc ribbon domain-containing protein [Metabacillus flavus]MBS2968744.1 zinc ribbon domain-containing protein [Metabacillus flavus]
MYCRECGKKLNGSEGFCPMCGTKVIKDPDSVHYDHQEEYLHTKSAGQFEQQEKHYEKDHETAESIHFMGHDERNDDSYQEKENNIYGEDHAEKDVPALNENEHLQQSHESKEDSHNEDGSSHSAGDALYPEEPQYDPYAQDRHDQIDIGNQTEFASASETNQSNVQHKRKATKKEWLLTIGIPAASLLLFTGTAFAVQSNEKNANQKAEALHYEGEDYALDGSYEQAVKKLAEASKIRPENSVIKRVKVEVESALKVEKTLSSIEQKIDSKEFGEAKDALNNVRNDIQARKSPIFAPLETKTSDQETELIVEMVKTETAEMDSVDEIGEQLKKIISLKTAEAEEVKGQLVKKIVAISQKTSEEYMRKKNFDAAIKALRSGLKYTNYENAELTSRLSEIEDQKLSYSGSLPVFLERHWSVINSKAMRSKKPPLKIGKVTFEEDQFTYVVTGKLKSMTRSTLNNPTLYLKIYDKKGKFLFNEDVSSKEVAIKSGQEAEFFFFLDKEYGKEIKIVLDQAVYRK